MMRYLFAVLSVLLLSGCASTPRQYYWGRYEEMLYSSYKNPSSVGELMADLEEQIDQLEQEKLKIPPGLYAELGTLYLQAGGKDKAIMMYGRERDSWPESKALMDVMITNLERSKKMTETNTGEGIRE